MALYQALRQLQPGTVLGGCEHRVAWRTDGGEQLAACADDEQALYAVADAMVEDTERRSSCRKAEEGNPVSLGLFRRWR